MTIGDRLKQIREEAGLKQKDIAEMLGIPLPDYNGIEKNEVDLTQKHLETLIKELDISIDWLIAGVEQYGIDNFGEFKESIKMMLHDMENAPEFLHGVLSYYFEKKQKWDKTRSNDAPIPPFTA